MVITGARRHAPAIFSRYYAQDKCSLFVLFRPRLGVKHAAKLHNQADNPLPYQGLTPGQGLR